jgi:hypothetical protein
MQCPMILYQVVGYLIPPLHQSPPTIHRSHHLTKRRLAFFTRLVKKTLKGEIYRSRPGTVDRQYHYQVMTVELIDEQLVIMGVKPPVELAIKHESELADVAGLLLMRDRVLARGILLDAAVARYLGITSKLLLDGDFINGSVDAGVGEGVRGDRSSMDLAVC